MSIPITDQTASGGGEEPTVRLADCPVGLFFNRYGGLCLKTEYGNNEGRIDAYIVESGEFFWGDPPQTIGSQRNSLVRPVNLGRLLAPLAAHPTGPGEAEPVAWDLGWHAMTEQPREASKVVALYNDGSGAALIYIHEGGAINSDGDDCAWPDTRFDRWAYLPANLEFFCELGSEERMTLPVYPPPAGDAGAEPAGEDDRPLAEQAKHHGRDWAVWWQGSTTGPSGERGDHIMELRQNGVGYARELAFLGADHHDQAGVLVAEHNEQMRRLREVLARQAAAKGLLQKEVVRLTPAEPAGFKCAARRQGSAGGNTPADCDWPVCGCDPHADKVIAALQESGRLTPAGNAGAEPAGVDEHVVSVPHPKWPSQWVVGWIFSDREEGRTAVRNLALKTARPTPAKPAVSPAGGEDLGGLKLALKIWHQNSQYPTASDGDLAIGAKAVLAALLPAASRPAADKGFAIGQRVRKVSGSSWQGTVVGYYSTDLTPDGICVESEREPGSVQIYPAKALALLNPRDDTRAGGNQAQEGGR